MVIRPHSELSLREICRCTWVTTQGISTEAFACRPSVEVLTCRKTCTASLKRSSG